MKYLEKKGNWRFIKEEIGDQKGFVVIKKRLPIMLPGSVLGAEQYMQGTSLHGAFMDVVQTGKNKVSK